MHCRRSLWVRCVRHAHWPCETIVAESTMSRIFAAIVSLIAAGAAMWVQSLARDMWQIRSLPERVMEWSLLFIPLDLFERGIQQFGPNAKELALVGNVLGMAISLALIGYVLLRRRASGGVILGVSVTLWLLA